MKNTIIVILLSTVGLYFVIAHYPPFPLSHEALGLFNHTVHTVIGVLCFVGAGFILWRGRKK